MSTTATRRPHGTCTQDASRPGLRSEHRPAAAGGLVAGRFRLQHLLARGGACAVWSARDEVLARRVALKCLSRPGGGNPRAALREARAAAAVRHRHVVDVHDLVLDAAGDWWLVMEALDGRSLADVIAGTGGLDPSAAHGLASALVDALAALHAAGVVHRDVKPANVQCCSDGRVVLTDLGVALHTGGTAQEPPSIAGTLAYLAPEVVTGGRSSPASDLYALGATLFCTLEGVPPFSVRSVQDLVEHAAARATPPSSARAGPLAPLLEGLLQPEPEDRWGAAEARAHLDGPARPGPGAVPASGRGR